MRKKINIAIILILINLAVFILLHFIGMFGDKEIIIVGGKEIRNNLLIEKIVGWLAVPSGLKQLLFRIWTPFTYMFLHEELFHLFGNMLWLYFLGSLFISFLDEKKLLIVYLLGGLSGAALYIIVYNIPGLKENAIALGASASVTAIVIATCVYKPDYTIRPFNAFNLKLKWLAVIFIAFDILSIFSGKNTGGHIAHLGGAIFGFIFAFKLKKGTDFTKGLGNLFDDIKKEKKKPKMEIIYKKPVPKSDSDYNKSEANREDEMNRILEKISKSGYDKLTKSEKEFLHGFKDD